MLKIVVKMGCPSTFFANISRNMRNNEIIVKYFFVENIIMRVLKKSSSKSDQKFVSYGQNSGQNRCPRTFFFENISRSMRNNENFVKYFFVENMISRVLKKSSSKSDQVFVSYGHHSQFKDWIVVIIDDWLVRRTSYGAFDIALGNFMKM